MPALQLDMRMTLARATEQLSPIELGPGVPIPGLRHVVVTAAAIATLVDHASGHWSVDGTAGGAGHVPK